MMLPLIFIILIMSLISLSVGYRLFQEMKKVNQCGKKLQIDLNRLDRVLSQVENQVSDVSREIHQNFLQHATIKEDVLLKARHDHPSKDLALISSSVLKTIKEDVLNYLHKTQKSCTAIEITYALHLKKSQNPYVRAILSHLASAHPLVRKIGYGKYKSVPQKKSTQHMSIDKA